jgi:ubiquinone/menaquinone biosynthesis C-methylase UbiE
MSFIQKTRDFFYFMRKGKKLNRVDQVRQTWVNRGWNYLEDQEKTLKEENGVEYLAQNEIFEFLIKANASTILEVGSGYGWNIQRLLREFPDTNIVGMDFSRPQLLRSKTAYPEIWDSDRIITLEGDITDMGLADKSVDVCFSLGILMNIPQADIKKGLKEIIRVTKNKIILFEYFVPNITSDEEIEAYEKHPYVYSHNYLKIMKKLGCELTDIDENRGTASERYTFFEFSVPSSDSEISVTPEFNRNSILACTKCKGALKEQGENLFCEKCRRSFPIEDDIPNMILEKTFFSKYFTLTIPKFR